MPEHIAKFIEPMLLLRTEKSKYTLLVPKLISRAIDAYTQQAFVLGPTGSYPGEVVVLPTTGWRRVRPFTMFAHRIPACRCEERSTRRLRYDR